MSKASAGAMELIPVYTVSHLESFLKEAGVNGWTILGTAGTEPDDAGDEESWHGEDKMERRSIQQVDCHEYIKQGPTLLALGMQPNLYFLRRRLRNSLPNPTPPLSRERGEWFASGSGAAV